MKTSHSYLWPLALFVFSVNLAEVIANRVDIEGNLDVDKSDVTLSRIAVTAGNSSQISVDKVLRTFAEEFGMLEPQFSEEYPLVARLYNKHCCPHIKLPPGLPIGGTDASLFIADYANLPSLAVLMTPQQQVKAKFAVVYGVGDDIGNPIFALLNSVTDTYLQRDQQLLLSDETYDIGIFKVPDEENRVQVYLTVNGLLQHEKQFNGFKTHVPGMIGDTEFKKQARLIGNTVTHLGGKFRMETGVLEMLAPRDAWLSSQFPPDSLVVADPSALRPQNENGPRSLAMLFSKGNVYPALVSWAEYDDHHRWKVYVRYLKNENTMEVFDRSITCAMFGPDLQMVLAPPPPDNQLEDSFLKEVKKFPIVPENQLQNAFQEGMKKIGMVNPFKIAVNAAVRNKMPKLPIPEGYFDTKVKTLPFQNGPNLYVLYHHKQRKYAYDNFRIFEHVFSGDLSARTGALSFYTFSKLMLTIGNLQAKEKVKTPAAMTFLLSEKRFAMGWPKDGVEVGTGHNCLIQDETEKVYIAGEILFAHDGVFFNFNSGTFTRQIAPEYFAGEDAFQTQWKGLIKQLISTIWDSKLSRLLDKAVPSPKVTYTDEILIPFTPPVEYTKQAFCQSEPWMQKCACAAYGESYLNYCELLPILENKGQELEVSLCNHDDCHPP